MSAAFRRMAITAFTTKRSPDMAASGRGEPVAYLTATTMRCTPIDPADSQRARELAFRLRQVTETPFEIVQCYVDASLDVIEGDVLIADGYEYPVRGVDIWAWRGSRYLHLLLEDGRWPATNTAGQPIGLLLALTRAA